MSGAATFARALVCGDIPDQDILTMAHAGKRPAELADYAAARSGLTYIRADDATDWLLNINGACRNHACVNAATTTDDNGRGLCAPCSSHYAAMEG